MKAPASLPLGISPPQQNLQRLVIIRWLMLAMLGVGMYLAYSFFEVALPYGTLLIIVAVLLLLNALSWWRLRQPWLVTQPEFGLQIFADILGMSVLFYFSGGASNPFVSYYLVPLSISAATMPWVYTWSLAVFSLCAYSLLLFFHVPIPHLLPFGPEHAEHNMGVNPHIIGMWFNFVLSAALITYFVVRMANTVREQERELNTHKEDELRDEQVLAVATLAAGTAHELGSPLTTMKVLLKEMQAEQQDANLQKDISVLQQQLEVCSTTLKQLAVRADVGTQQGRQQKSIKAFCQSLVERWLVLRPEASTQVHYEQNLPDFIMVYHSTIEQALINLLNNAADANPKDLQIKLRWDSTTLYMTILDRGPGVSPAIKNRLGHAFVTTKGKGLGLGLFLSNATLSRYGGRVELFDREDGGTRTEIVLPLNRVEGR